MKQAEDTSHLEPIGTMYKTAHITSLTESRPLSVCIMTWRVTGHKLAMLHPGRDVMKAVVECIEKKYFPASNELYQLVDSNEDYTEELRHWLAERELDCRVWI